MNAFEMRLKAGLIKVQPPEPPKVNKCPIGKICREILATYKTHREASAATGLNHTKVFRILSEPDRKITTEDAQKILMAHSKTLAVISYNTNPIPKDLHETDKTTFVTGEMETTVTGCFRASP